MEAVAKEFGLLVKASADSRTANGEPRTSTFSPHAARGDVSTVDRREHGRGWTRWVLEQVRVQPDLDPQRRHRTADCASASTRSSSPIRIHAGSSTARRGSDSAGVPRASARPGVEQLSSSSRRRHADHDGAMPATRDRESCPIPVRNLKKGLTRDQHFAPGAILNVESTPAAHRSATGGAATYASNITARSSS